MLKLAVWRYVTMVVRLFCNGYQKFGPVAQYQLWGVSEGMVVILKYPNSLEVMWNDD